MEGYLTLYTYIFFEQIGWNKLSQKQKPRRIFKHSYDQSIMVLFKARKPEGEATFLSF
jgi:hypothetical protein